MIPDIDHAILESRTDQVRIRMPETPAAYRSIMYAYDDAAKAATANVPLLVKGEARIPMPFVVYEDNFDGMPWAPSGWMGVHQYLDSIRFIN